MSKHVDADKIIKVIKEFLSYNEGDEATEYLIIAIGAQILGMTSDDFAEIVKPTQSDSCS